MAKEHVFTEGEKRCMEEYWKNASKTPRKNLIKLVKHINMLNPFPSEKSWEYIFFDRNLSDEMIDLLLKMKLRKKYYIDELTGFTKKSVEETAKLVDDICHIGILEYCTDDNGVDRVLIPVFAPGSMESTVMTKEMTDAYPEMAPAFLNYVKGLQENVASLMPLGNALMRAIPVEAAITNNSEKVKYDEVSYWLDKSGESLAVAPCECRKLRQMTGEGTGDVEVECCISIGKYAESCIRMGKAKRITREEAESILKRAEDRGAVHQLSNVDGPDGSVFICNCGWDTCMALKTAWYTQTPSMSRSNYVAEVDTEACVACGGCVEVCPQNATKLGQKLCQKEPVKIAKKDIADDHLIWTKKNWQPDFLTNRENVVPETGTAPCKTNCPAHIAVQGYLKKAGEGKYQEALELIKKENPFPAVCGRVCARFCEQVCTRGDQDEPVAIDEIKKFIAEQELHTEKRYIPKKKFDFGGKVAVIGAGPAGLTCAYFLAIYGHSVTVFEKEKKAGGMMQFGIPAFRLEKDIVDAEIEVIKELGVEIKTGVEIGKDFSLNDLRKQGYQGFYVAIGAQGGRKLGIANEDAKGVISGIDFLRESAMGTIEQLAGKVVVIGGGNVAIDVARSAVRYGGKNVGMYCLEQKNEMPASEEEVIEAEEENITMNCGWGPKEILTENGKVKGVVLKKCTSVKDAEGRFNPIYDESETMIVECDYVLSAIGQSIQWGNILEGAKVELNRNQTARADERTYQTKQEDVFVGGDVYTGPRFAIDAIAAGKEGAESLHRYVREGHSLTLGRVKRDNFHLIDKDNIKFEEYDTARRQKPVKDKSKELTFFDDRMTLTEEQVKVEAARCLGCGAVVVDQNICIGCGLCTTRCKFDAIHLIRKFNEYGPDYDHIVPAIAKYSLRKAKRAITHTSIMDQ